MAGPSGTTRRARGRSSAVGVRLNCHQTKNAVDTTNPTIDTYAFSRSPKYSCAGSMRSSSSKKRPKH